MKTLFKRYWKTALWSLIMCYLLFSPGSALPKSGLHIPHFDKMVHAGMFAILVFLFRLDSMNVRFAKLKVGLLIFAILLFSSLSEYIQYAYIPGRSGNIYDLVADVVGVVIGIILFRIFGKKVSVFLVKS